MEEIFDAKEARRLTQQAINSYSPENLKKVKEIIKKATENRKWSVDIDITILDPCTLRILANKKFSISEIRHDPGDGPCRPAWDYRTIS